MRTAQGLLPHVCGLLLAGLGAVVACGGALEQGGDDAGATTADASTVSDGTADTGLHDARVPDGGLSKDAPNALPEASPLPDATPPTACTHAQPCRLYTGNNGLLGGIAVDTTNVYFVENRPGAVFSVPIGGGPVATLATDPAGPYRVAVSEGGVYWTGQGGGVQRVPLDGGAITAIAAPGNGTTGIVVDSSRVYWARTEQDAYGAILSAPLSGGSATTIASNQDAPLALAVTGTTAYWLNDDIYGPMDGGCLMAASLDGGPPQALSPFHNLGGQAVAVDQTHVYWAESQSIFSMPLGGGPTSTLVAGMNPTDIAVDGTYVYFTDYGMNAILKVPVGGGPVDTVATSFQQPQSIAIDETNVYWTDFADLVMQAPK